MPRSDRLLRLLALMRRLPAPVTAARLAGEAGVSERTIRRDIEGLRAAGARIDGAPGYGYHLTEDPALPPQVFSRLEIEALTLGLAYVQDTGDDALAGAAQDAMAKITATLPERRQIEAVHAILMARRWEPMPPGEVDAGNLREAAWEETELEISYCDGEDAVTRRRVWPLAIAYLDHAMVMLAWCCLREDFRTFRVDRIGAAHRTGHSFRPRRAPLLREMMDRLRARAEMPNNREQAGAGGPSDQTDQ